MTQVDHGAEGATPGGRAPAAPKALPLRTIPHFAVPAGATSPIPPALVEAMRTTYSWTPAAPARPRLVWTRPDEATPPWEPPAA